jgi:cell division protease FtsH
VVSETLGPATFEATRPALFLPETAAPGRAEYSERIAEVIDEEMRKLLLAAQDRVRESLTARRQELEALAKELLRHEVVDRATLTRLLAAAGTTPNVPRATTPGPVDMSSAA